MRIKWALSLILAVALSGCVSLITPTVQEDLTKLKAGGYALDKTHARLLFKIRHLGLSTYVGRFNDFDASLEFDPNNMASAKLTAVIDMGSVDLNDEGLESDLLGRSWFRVSEYPQAVFESTLVIPVTATEFEFTGNLSWRGVVKPITISATFEGGANNVLTGKYTLGFSAKGRFLRSEFGMEKYIPLVGDEVRFETYAEFLKN
jgi:polyisoprenoid-binding protein YceI